MAIKHFENNKKRQEVKTTKTYLPSGMKSKINTEWKMKGVKWRKCGDAGPAGRSGHSVTLSHPTGTAVNHTH